MKKFKKILMIVLSSLLALVLIAGLILDNIGVTYELYDDVKVIKNEDYNVKVVENQKYLTIAKYNKDGFIVDDDFRIMCFADIHLDHKKDLSEYTFNMIVRNIVNEKPDFVVFLGDNLTSALNKPRTKQLAQLMEELGVYYSFVLGNHEHSEDNKFSISRERMVKIFSKYEHCLINAEKLTTADGQAVWGAGNTVINILNSQGITQTLFLMDSGSEMSQADQEKYAQEIKESTTKRLDDYIKDSQVSWYVETLSDILKDNPNVKSTLFCHIPLMEANEAYDLFSGERKVNPYNEELNYVDIDANVDGIIAGIRGESICYSGHRSKIFETVLKLGSTQAIFFGHDHANNYLMRYQGVLLGAAQTAGYSSYNHWTKGLSENLIEGYNIYTYSYDGNISIETKVNQDIWGNDLYKQVVKLLEESRGHKFESKRSDYQ